VAVSFISPAQGWLIGSLSCQQCLGVEATFDSGATWAVLPSPNVTLAGPGAAVSNVFFADGENGYLFDPGIQVTHDGGKDWSENNLIAVSQIASANGDVFALSQVPDKPARGLFRAPVGEDT